MTPIFSRNWLMKISDVLEREIAAVTLQLHAALIEATLADAGFGEPRPGQTDG